MATSAWWAYLHTADYPAAELLSATVLMIVVTVMTEVGESEDISVR